MSQSIRRAIDLIRRSAEQPLSLTEAADVLGVHKSTALRILQTLEAARFVRRTGAGTYVLGSGVIELSEIALGSMDLRQFAAAHLRALQRETGHTVHLGQLTGDEIIYIDKVDSQAFDAVKLPSRVGRAVSIYASAVGKTILAYLPPEERDASSPTSSSSGSPTPPSPTTTPSKPNSQASANAAGPLTTANTTPT